MASGAFNWTMVCAIELNESSSGQLRASVFYSLIGNMLTEKIGTFALMWQRRRAHRQPWLRCRLEARDRRLHERAFLGDTRLPGCNFFLVLQRQPDVVESFQQTRAVGGRYFKRETSSAGG